jgi:hypothetical protein
MSSGTATKLVAVFAIGGVGMSLWFGKGGSDRYRKVWGVVLLSAVAAAMADFAPALVGWFIGLVIVAYAIGHTTNIATAVAGAKAQATGKG